MKHKPKSPEEIQAEVILNRAKQIQAMSAVDRLELARKELHDTKVQLGYKIGFGLSLIQMMQFWEVTAEEMKEFISKHNEFLEVYGSTDEKDKQTVVDWFKELEKATGYRIVEG